MLKRQPPSKNLVFRIIALWFGAIVKIVNGLEVGVVSDPQEFGTAFVVLQVVSRESITFEAVEAELTQQLRSEPPPRPDLSLYRNILMKQAKIEVLDGMNR